MCEEESGACVWTGVCEYEDGCISARVCEWWELGCMNVGAEICFGGDCGVTLFPTNNINLQ